MAVFTPQFVGFVHSPYTDSKAIPKGLGARHDDAALLLVRPSSRNIPHPALIRE
jgi:hypothetical protein